MGETVDYIIRFKDLASKVLYGTGKAADDAASKFDKLDQSAKKASGGLGAMNISASNLIKGFLGLQAVQKGWEIFRNDILGAGADLEQTKISFEVMLGSADKAGKMIQDLQKFGQLTPFETKDLNENAKLLMNFGIESEKIIPVLGMLGDVSGGNKEKLDGLALAYAQVQSTGRLMGQDLLQMINAGFNPLQEISKATGKSMKDLKEAMSDGAISADMVTNAFIRATGEGGQFYNMMQKQSETTLGRWSTLKDKIALIFTGMGESMLGTTNKMIDQVNYAIDWIKTNWGSITDIFAPLMESVQPILDVFDELRVKIFGTGDAGNFLSNVFNLIGSILKTISPLLKLVGSLTAWVVGVIAKLVEWLMSAVKWIGELFGYADKGFKAPKIEDTSAYAKELQEQKGVLLGDKYQGNNNVFAGLSDASSIKGTGNRKGAASASRSVQITVNIDALNKGGITINSQTITEGAGKIRDIIVEELVRAATDWQRVAGI